MVYDAHVRRLAAVLQRAVGRVASASDYRTAGDIKVTKYFGNHAVSVGASSRRSRTSCRAAARSTCSSSARTATARGFGVAGTNDRINAINGVAPNPTRNSLEFVVGITQALSPNDIVQSNLTYYTGPRLLLRPVQAARHAADRPPDVGVAHPLQPLLPDRGRDAAARLSAAVDSFGSTSNMFEAAWAQALPYGFSVTPGLRFYTQTRGRLLL